jgi:hypothetical protein
MVRGHVVRSDEEGGVGAKAKDVQAAAASIRTIEQAMEAADGAGWRNGHGFVLDPMDFALNRRFLWRVGGRRYWADYSRRYEVDVVFEESSDGRVRVIRADSGHVVFEEGRPDRFPVS